MVSPLSRRKLLGALSIATIGLSGCLGDGDDTFRLDPDDFDDAYLHLVAEGIDRGGLELVSIDRVDGWIEASVQTDLDLERYFGPDPPEFLEEPIDDHIDTTEFARAPGVEPIVDWYIRAVEEGEGDDGLRVDYADGTCQSWTHLPRNRADWYLNGTLDRRVVYAEFSAIHYRIECPG